jgi:hypothetical protein
MDLKFSIQNGLKEKSTVALQYCNAVQVGAMLQYCNLWWIKVIVCNLWMRTVLVRGEVKKHGCYRNDAGGGGEAEGAAAARVDLTRSVTSLLDAMRDLLSNINFQPDVPNDADIDEDSDD